MSCPLSEARTPVRAFARVEPHVTYFAYLDEFGHIGPYVATASAIADATALANGGGTASLT